MKISSPMKVFGGTCRSAGALALFLTLSVGLARADSVAYISSTSSAGGNKSITAWDVDTNTNAFVTFAADGQPIDSLMFVSNSELIYDTEPTTGIGGTIDAFTCTAFAANGTCSGSSTNTILSSSSLLHGPSDMVLDPGGTTLLVGNAFSNTLDRVVVATGVTTQLHDYGGSGRIDGLTYVGTRLFAVLNRASVVELDPTNGNVLNTISGLNQADGLSYDSTAPFDGLYVGSDAGGFYKVNIGLTTAAFTSVNGFVIDGLAATGNLLYLIRRDTAGLQYNLTTGMITETSPTILGADDIAPPTFISINNSPEPSTALLIGFALVLVGIGSRRLKFSGQQ